MNIPIFQVDAFTDTLFAGNPAAVMLLDDWLCDELLQSIAAENNLSETAFLVPSGDDYALRWFTPAAEVDLCGHATLASAHVLLSEPGRPGATVRFHTRSGELAVTQTDAGLCMDFPAYELISAPVDIAVCDALGATASEVLQVAGAAKQVFVFEFEEDVAALTPDFHTLRRATQQCVIATAPADSGDFVSRFFAPALGIDEDPVTGSAHCALVPYWSRRLGRTALNARQISARGGQLCCELAGDRVRLQGQAVTFLRGEVCLPD